MNTKTNALNGRGVEYLDFYDQVTKAKEQDKGERIYKELIPEYIPGSKKKIFSPLRDENHPSFTIQESTGLFRDWGTDENGDALTFIMHKMGIDFNQSCVFAANLYGIKIPEGLNNNRINTNPDIPKVKNKKTTQKSLFDKEILDIKFRNYLNSEETKFWKDKADADQEAVLSTFKIIDSFTLKNGKSEIVKEGLSCCFAIEVIPGKKYKIYQPITKAYGSEKSSWIGSSLDEFREIRKLPKEYRYSLGIDDLDSSKYLLLCEGEADYVALRSKGYNAFTLGSVISSIPNYIQNNLQDKGIDLKNIVVVFDVDKTGIEHSKELSEKYGCKRIEIPNLDGSKGNNDICDYIHLYGFDDRLKSILDQYNKEIVPTKEQDLGFRMTFDFEPEFTDPVILLEGTKCLRKGNVMILASGWGTGKSQFCEALVAKYLNPKCDAFGFEVEIPEGKKILYIDTEREKNDVRVGFDRIQKRVTQNDIYNLIKYKEGNQFKNVMVDCFIQIPSTKLKVAELEKYIHRYGHELGLLIIDGAADFITDVNNLEETQNFAQMVIGHSNKYNFATLMTIHTNPRDNKPRGHLGSEFGRKCDSMFLLKKADENPEIRIITTDFEYGKNRSGSDQLETYFRWNNKLKMFSSTDYVRSDGKQLKLDLKVNFNKVYGQAECDKIHYNKLLRTYVDQYDVSAATAKRHIKNALDIEILEKEKGEDQKVYYKITTDDYMLYNSSNTSI